MKLPFLSVALVALAATSISPSVAADSADATPKVYAITAQNGSGETGTVALIPHGAKTDVIVAIVGAPPGIPEPAHIHPGSCSKLDPTPKYPLKSLKDGLSTTQIDATIPELTGGGFAVNLHKSADDLKTYVACGDLHS